MLLDGFVVARQVYQLAFHALLAMHIDAQLQFGTRIPDSATVKATLGKFEFGYYGIACYLPLVA